ncbi:uncharacterized protein G2W53_036235 [Senna tora]|uniref:Uncharacterized protein n=1 Tax=Senna tora TaxID=362788 RepID=A0A834SX44_9FABA|nr:uncharacterized protein G2W53_036235 [Senna tora]
MGKTRNAAFCVMVWRQECIGVKKVRVMDGWMVEKERKEGGVVEGVDGRVQVHFFSEAVRQCTFTYVKWE